MAVKISDIAQKLGISEATVSLALNNKSVVNRNTKQRVKETAIEMGYYPNAMARGLASSKNRTIGIIVPDITNPYFGELVKFCGEYIREYGYSVVFAFSNDSSDMETQIVDQFISERVAGVMIAPTNRNTLREEYVQKLERYDIKYIFLTSYYHGAEAPYVMVDLENGSYQLIRYLLDMGHRNIYFLCSDPAMIPTLTRINGYRRAFLERGLSIDENRFINCISVTFDRAYTVTQNLLKTEESIDAIVTMNDIMALGALRALLDSGIRVPEEISLAGYDDVVFSSISAIPITTVKQDIPRMSRAAVDILFEMIDSEQQRTHLMIEPELIVRRSTGSKKT